jgi:hypothetical protein
VLAPVRRIWLAAAFWLLFGVLLVFDWNRGSAARNRFDEPAPWALGSGKGPAAQGAHCAAVPRK